MAEIYISTDIEADGPIPGPYSMLSIGAGAFVITQTDGVKLVSSFCADLKELAGAVTDPATMEFWYKHPEAWELNRRNPQPPEIVMKHYLNWLTSLGGEPVFIGWPATYDFMFVYWYLIRFIGRSPFQHSGLDAKSYAMAVEKQRWQDISLDRVTALYHQETANPHPHVAFFDAVEQGWCVCNMIYNNMFSANRRGETCS